ncbi:hypothetical protein [Lewinella cohaerens]|uniref:hypothetical protein n=1 Tax=Lewinella cohaerens TaxID=70995 RepID=UPI0003687193|nr:hypothetical protein [Lewinella cohaerens]
MYLARSGVVFARPLRDEYNYNCMEITDAIFIIIVMNGVLFWDTTSYGMIRVKASN